MKVLQLQNLKHMLLSSVAYLTQGQKPSVPSSKPSVDPAELKMVLRDSLRSNCTIHHFNNHPLFHSDVLHTMSNEEYDRFVELKSLTGGNSNTIFTVHCNSSTHHQHPLLLRVYGAGMEGVVSRHDDVAGTCVMSEAGLGPRMVASFEWGRLEEFFVGAESMMSSDWADTTKPWALRQVASLLKQAHETAPPHSPETAVDGATALQRILNRLLALLSQKTAADAVHSKQLIDEARDEVEWLLRQCQAYPIVFSHNDLNPGNIMLLPRDEKAPNGHMKLIDFEYSGQNYRCFDLGNTLCEVDYDYSLQDTPDNNNNNNATLSECAAALPTTRLVEHLLGFRKPLHWERKQSGCTSEDPFSPLLPQIIWAAFCSQQKVIVEPSEVDACGHECTSSTNTTLTLGEHILRNYILEYFHPGNVGKGNAVATVDELREVLVGMLASHLVWGLWGAVLGMDGLLMTEGRDVPLGASGLDYIAYGECRLREYILLKEWLRQVDVLPV